MEPINPLDLARATGDYDAIGAVPEASHIPHDDVLTGWAVIIFAAASAIGVIVFLQYLSVRAL